MVFSNSLNVCASDSGIAPIANPTQTSETLTTEEMAALFAGSKCTYTYEVWNDDKSALEPEQKGSVTPVIRYFKNENLSSGNIFIPPASTVLTLSFVKFSPDLTKIYFKL